MIRLPNKEARELVEWAKERGWSVTIRRGGHLRFTRPGCPPYFTGSTPSDRKTQIKARKDMERIVRGSERT